MRNRKLVNDITLDALFIGLVVVMSLVPFLGFISIGGISATILPIPVILGTAFLGWKRGILYGVAFGVSSFLIAITRGTAADAIFVDPLVSILPRTVFGLVIGLFSILLFNRKISAKLKRIFIIPFSAFSMLLHSALVLTMLFIRYTEDFNTYILPILVPLVLIEMAIATVVTPLLFNALYKVFENRRLRFEELDPTYDDGSNINFAGLVAIEAEESLNNLIQFVNIDSVYDPKTVSEETPYGLGVSKALAFIRELAERDGFEARDVDGRAIEIYFGDKNLPNIGIFAHADVVPATGKWESPPFDAQIRDEKLYGRGTSDDKGPTIAAYYATKALYDHNLINNYSVRLVIGGDEERGSSCMRYYFNEGRAPAPFYGFTPDAEFPLIYGEKAITNFISSLNIDLKPIISIKGGEAANSVIDRVEVLLPKDKELLSFLDSREVKYEVKNAGKNYVLTFLGKSAHGSLPALGENAGIIAFRELGEFYKLDHLSLLAAKFSDPSGKTLDAYLETPLLGESTYNIGLLSYVDGNLSFTTNFRYPEDVDLEAHLEKISENIQMEVSVKSTSKHLLFDPESKFIKTLLSAYQDETGDLESKPLAIGGGTYAKACPSTVAFGSAFKGRPGDIHSPNEHIYIADFYAQMAIYARAIYYLGTRLCE